MTTATDWDVRDAQTNDRLLVTDVESALAEQQAAFLPDKPDHIHDDLCRTMRPGEYADEPTPEAGSHIPDADDLRERNRLTQASIRLLSVLDAKAQLWREVASDAWAHQGEVSRISDTYLAKREATERYYREACQQIWGMTYHGVLSTTSQPALPVSAHGEAFLAQGPAPDDSMAGRAPNVMDAFNRRHGIASTTQVAGQTATYNETAPGLEREPERAGWKRPNWLTRLFDDIFPIKPRDPRKDGGS